MRLCLFFRSSIARLHVNAAKMLDKDQAEWCRSGVREADMEPS